MDMFQIALTRPPHGDHDAAMSDHVEKFVDVQGGFLYSRTYGRGQDVVLLNAGAADVRMWDTTIPWLAQIARVVTFDYRDTGLSSAGKQPYSEVDDVAAVMDAHGVRSAILIGVSDGARRGLAFAHRYPERTSHVVAIGGAFGEFPDPTPQESAARQVMSDHFVRRAAVHKSEGIHAAAEADIRAWGAALDGDQLRRMIGLQVANSYWIDLPDEDYLGSELDPPVKHRFSEISAPISVVVGGHDFEGTRLWAQRIADQAPHATLTLLPDADHFPMLSAPAEFQRIVREVLS
jgi:pimeloyl-ACP methyl ester carboxylesterase